MKLLLVDPNGELGIAWRHHFAGQSDVEVALGRFEEHLVGCDAVVTAGNSFGMMDGGIDLAVRDHFNAADPAGLYSTQEAVQRAIRDFHAGFCPIGSAIVTSTPTGIRLIYAPTMELPANVSNTANAYIAARGAFMLALRLGVRRLLCPGLATGVGRMPARVAAAQMRLAWDHVHAAPTLPDWPAVHELCTQIRTAGR